MRSKLALLIAAGAVALVGAIATSGQAASAAAPTNTKEPKISGTPIVGRTLTTTRGEWTGKPDSYSYQWVRCPKSGGQPNGRDCAAISGATTRSYVLGGGDADRRLRVLVTAGNEDGDKTAASNATPVIARPGDIVNTEQPTISGSAVVGSTLTASPGSWSGNNLSYSYSWRRCDADGAGCSTIANAKEQKYTIQQTDAGNTIRVRVVARNQDRSEAATSKPTDRVTTAGQPGKDGCPSGSGPVSISSVSSPARLLIDRQTLSPPVVNRNTGSVTLRVHVSACNGRSVQGALVYSAAVPYNQWTGAEKPTDANGWATIDMRRLRGYPVSDVQQLLVLFLRARKQGESTLGGISTRRLVSFSVRLNG